MQQWQSILGNIALVLGGISGGLALIDWLLPENVRKSILSASETAWIWLSYQRTLPYVALLRKDSAPYILFLTALLYFVVGGPIIWARLGIPLEMLVQASAMFAGLFLLSAGVCYLLRKYIIAAYRWVVREGSTLLLVVRAVGAYLAFFAILYGWIYVVILLQSVLIGSPAWQYVYFAILFITFAATCASFIILGALLFILIYVILVYLLIGLFMAAQIVVRGIVEHSKGPVLGLAALLAAIGTILKAFAG